MEKKTFIVPPPPPTREEDPGATKRPGPPPTTEELEAAHVQAINIARAGALREQQIQAVHDLGEDIRQDSVAGPAMAADDQALRTAFAHRDAASLTGLDVDTTHAPAAGIEDMAAYRQWLQQKLAGAPSTEAPPHIPEETS